MPFMTAAVLTPTLTTEGLASAIGGIIATGPLWEPAGLSAITAGMIAADAALIAGGVGAYGSWQAGEQAEAFGKSQQELNEYNAMLDKREAERTLAVTAYEEARHREAGEKFKARQRVGYAHAGVTMEGTPMDMLEQTAINLEKDALSIRYGGQVGAGELTSSAQMRRIAGRSALLKGRAQRRAYRTAAFGQGLGGAADAYRYRLEVA